MRRALSIGFVAVAGALAVASVASACTNYLGKMTVRFGEIPGTYAGNTGVSYAIAGTSLSGHSGVNCGYANGYRAKRSTSIAGSFRVIVEPAPAPCQNKLANNGAGPGCLKYAVTNACIPNKLHAGPYNVTVQNGVAADCMSSNTGVGLVNGNGEPIPLGEIWIDANGYSVEGTTPDGKHYPVNFTVPHNTPPTDYLQVCVSNAKSHDPLRPTSNGDGNQVTIGLDVVI